ELGAVHEIAVRRRREVVDLGQHEQAVAGIECRGPDSGRVAEIGVEADDAVRLGYTHEGAVAAEAILAGMARPGEERDAAKEALRAARVRSRRGAGPDLGCEVLVFH